MASQWTRRFNKRSLNKYSAVIFDLSGVLVDFGMHAPVLAVARTFRNHNIYVSEKRIRENINKNQEHYIKSLCNFNKCENKFQEIYTDYLNELIILNTSPEFNEPINGAIKTTHLLRNNGYKIGITTSYNKNTFSVIDKSFKRNGLIYDAVVCNDDVLLGKPEPFMLYKMSNKLNVPTNKCIKVGESTSSILEGINAKVDTINVIDSSNYMGMDEQIFDDTCEQIKMCKRNNIMDNMDDVVPKYFISSVSEIGKFLKYK
uniref:Haloacid dehalogenase-like hydrolase n=1 Tax=viral metagenome TaxID=1070528 RepID=A0A6C0HXB3_9ZZZZ